VREGGEGEDRDEVNHQGVRPGDSWE